MQSSDLQRIWHINAAEQSKNRAGDIIRLFVCCPRASGGIFLHTENKLKTAANTSVISPEPS